MPKVMPKEIRAARAYLYKRGIRSSDVSPRRFAAAAKETGQTFGELTKKLARMYMGGQGAGPSPRTTEALSK